MSNPHLTLDTFKLTKNSLNSQFLKYTVAVIKQDLVEKQLLELFPPDRERKDHCVYEFYVREEAERFFKHMHSNNLTVCKYYI